MTTMPSGKSNERSKSSHKPAGQSAHAEEPMHMTEDVEEPTHPEFETGVTERLTLRTELTFLIGFRNRINFLLSIVTGTRLYQRLMGQLNLVLSGGVSSRKYATSIMKTKATDYGHIKWIKDLVPNTMWSPVLVDYDKHALWGISHWGRKRQQFYGFAVNREFARDVYSKHRIIAVTKLETIKWQNYKHLDWITIRRDDDKLYKFKEGDLKRLRIQDIEDMLLLLIQGKLTNLTVEERLAFNNKDKKNILMRIDELHKFSDGTLDDVRTALNDHLIKYSNPMIQPEPEGSTQGYPLDSVEVLRLDTSAGNPVKEILLKLNLPDHKSILTDSKVTPTKHRILKDGGEDKEFQRSFRHSDTERLSRSNEVLKLKNFKKDATLKLFKSTNHERYEHVGSKVTSSQDGETRLCLVDDLKVFKESHTRQDEEQAHDLTSMITTSIHKIEVYELKTKDKA
ncbi:hypothetical protein Tco_1183642 [Tanacetum coccineum]